MEWGGGVGGGIVDVASCGPGEEEASERLREKVTL